MSWAASDQDPLGVTHGVLHASLLLTDTPGFQVTGASPPKAAAADPALPVPGKKVVWWLVLLVGSLMIGSHLAGRVSGQARLLPKPRSRSSWPPWAGSW